MNSFVYLIVVPTQIHLSYPLSVSSKTDWADTVPHSLWSKLLRAWCLRPTRQRSVTKATLELRAKLLTSETLCGMENDWNGFPSSHCQITHLASFTGECFCPRAHLSNNTPRSVWSRAVWTEQRQWENNNCLVCQAHSRLKSGSKLWAQSPTSTHHNEQSAERKLLNRSLSLGQQPLTGMH